MDPAPGPARQPDPPLVLDVTGVPSPDWAAEPAGFIVGADDGTRIHFLDWGGPSTGAGAASIVLVPGFGETAWSWAPVARRLCGAMRCVAVDLRGHGLSDAPAEGYDLGTLATDVLAVAAGAGLLDGAGRIVLAGHGFGAAVAAWVAASLGASCAGLVLVDGGWEALAVTTDLDPDEFLRTLDEPPEVLRSIHAYLADRVAFDPASWDRDQERAAREAVAEQPSGRLVPATHPHVRAALVESMFAYDPVAALSSVDAPTVALAAGEGEGGAHVAALERTAALLVPRGHRSISVASFPEGHNLMRYRPAEVSAAILAVSARAGTRS